MRIRPAWEMMKATLHDWSADKVPRLGAALAFYSVLSLGPLLLMVIAVAGLAFGHDVASAKIIEQIRGLVGDQGAEAIKLVIENSQKHQEDGIFALIVGIGTLILGATGVFGQLQDALNTIWKVEAKPDRSFWWMVRERFLSFAAVLGTGFLLLVSLVISSALSALDDYFAAAVPGFVLQIVNIVVSFGVITALFAMIFKLLPDVVIRWNDVWIGAVITAALFTLGKWLIGLYLGHSAVGSVYGASGSLIVILLWVYYSSQILFFGAELTQVYAKRSGSPLRPARGAVAVTDESRARQGMKEKKKEMTTW